VRRLLAQGARLKPARPQRAPRQATLDYAALADEFARAFAATKSIPLSLERVFAVAARGPGPRDNDWADAAIAAVARRHGITVEKLVFGGRELASARGEAYYLLHRSGMTYRAIAARFHVSHTVAMEGARVFERRLGAAAAQVERRVG